MIGELLPTDTFLGLARISWRGGRVTAAASGFYYCEL
jgi:hypothetical protein